MREIDRRTFLLPLAALGWNQLIYLGANHLAQHWPHHNMELGVDRLIPFAPWTVSIYLGCYLFWIAVYLLCARQSKVYAYHFFCADFLAKCFCLVFFLALPTAMIRPSVDGTDLWNMLIQQVYHYDAPHNLFPSLHCLISWLCFLGVRRYTTLPRPIVWLTGLLACAICLSTLTTRQHVLVDVAGGILIAEICFRAASHRRILRPTIRVMDRILKR